MEKFKKWLLALWKAAFELAAITAACALMAISFPMFFIPNQIAPGGFSGIATILNAIFAWNVGLTNFIMCLPLFLATIRILDWKSFIKNLYGTAAFSFFIDFFSQVPPISSGDRLLASIFGGITLGAGCGLCYRFSASTGGSDLLALLIAKKARRKISAGAALMIVDGLVVCAAGLWFHSIELSLYAFVSIYTSMKAIDFVADGAGGDKAFYIFSEETEKVKDAIIVKLNRGVTLMPAKGGYLGIEKDALFAVVSRQQAPMLKTLIRQIDPKAFVILIEAHEVLGEGFQGWN